MLLFVSIPVGRQGRSLSPVFGRTPQLNMTAVSLYVSTMSIRRKWDLYICIKIVLQICRSVSMWIW